MTGAGLRALAVAVTVAATALGCAGSDPAPVIFASDCEQCHLTEYNLAVAPPHLDVYPPRCVACHHTDAWRPRDYTGHDQLFPIGRGKHRGLECADCHVPPDALFGVSCIDCHNHAEAPMAREHDGRGGYSWATAACLRCHPEGNE
jgi:hypothetical protein